MPTLLIRISTPALGAVVLLLSGSEKTHRRASGRPTSATKYVPYLKVTGAPSQLPCSRHATCLCRNLNWLPDMQFNQLCWSQNSHAVRLIIKPLIDQHSLQGGVQLQHPILQPKWSWLALLETPIELPLANSSSDWLALLHSASHHHQ